MKESFNVFNVFNILIAVTLGVIIFGCSISQAKRETKKTKKNGITGFCTECGAELEFKNYSQGHTEKYVFQCTECDKIVEIHYNPYN